MEKQITKKQHYVWKHYLKGWSSQDRVWWLNKGIIKNTKTTDILRGKSFYKIRQFGNNELEFINKNYLKDELSKKLFIPFYNFLEKIEKTNSNTLSISMEDFRIQLGEDLISLFEVKGVQFLEKIKNFDPSFYDYDNQYISVNDFLSFLVSQFMRTKKMADNYKNSLLEMAEANHLDLDAVWLAVQYLYVQEYTLSIINKKKHFLRILKNISNLQFITSDQPVINLDWPDKSKQVLSVKFYYPINDKIALILTDDILSNEVIEISGEEVERFNKIMIIESDGFIIANNRECLEDINK